MDIIDENKYNEIKNILLGCRNISDAKYFIKLYLKHNPESKKLADNLISGKFYDECNNLTIFNAIIEQINESNNYDFCMKLIEDNYNNNNNNNIQIKTLMKIINNKVDLQKKNINEHKNKKFSFNSTLNIPQLNQICQTKTIKKQKSNEIVKKCPHCSYSYTGNENTLYVICGYNDNRQGYDWEGCTKDWCFVCGKKLCKLWDKDKLWLEPNRIHNSYCCKSQALENYELYDNYCQCNHKYVNRELK